MLAPLRLVMMGTGPFAAPTLRALLQSRHTVVALVTQPVRPGPGNKPPPPSPMRVVALEHGLPILDPPSINTDEARQQLAAYMPDLLIVADYGQILSPDTLAVAPLGGVNLHGSLLPKYRGAAPINWAIYNGDQQTGVTVIHMTPQIDAGPCLAQAATDIDPEENAVELERRLADLGAPLIVRTIDDLQLGHTVSIPQDRALTTRAPRLKKTDGQIDWRREAAAIKNQIRALEPWPKTFTYWQRPPAEPMRWIVGNVTVLPAPATSSPGAVLTAAGKQLIVATGDGALAINTLQPAGKKMLTADEFLRGHAVQVGQLLGPGADS